MNRKEFISKSALGALGLLTYSSWLSCSLTRAKTQPLSVSSGQLQNVRGNVYRFNNGGGTVGVLENRDGFVIIDSQFPKQISPLVESIKSSNKEVLYLANTHHHADHTAGNLAFKDIARKVVAHHKVPELQRQSAVERNNLAEQYYPTELFDEIYKFELRGDRVTGYHFGAGHTQGDAVYYFENDGVVHLGDLMFINMIPVYRPKDGANARTWVQILDKVLLTFPEDTLYIFGHADTPENTVGTKTQIKEMRSFLAESIEFVQSKKAQGISPDQITQHNQFIPGFKNRTTPSRWPDYVKGLYDTI